MDWESGVPEMIVGSRPSCMNESDRDNYSEKYRVPINAALLEPRKSLEIESV